MKKIRYTLLVAGLAALAVSHHYYGLALAGSFTQSSAARTYSRGQAIVDAIGNLAVSLSVFDAAGVQLETRNVYVPASGGAITDQYGNVIAASVPAGLANAITSFSSSLDSAISNAAAGGRFNR